MMAPFEIYIIKSGITLGIFYLVYWAILKNETYFSWKRMYILSSLFFAIIIPYIKIPFLTTIIPANFILEPIQISETGEIGIMSPAVKTLHVVSIIYICGAILFALRFLSGLFQIFHLYHKHEKVWYQGFKTVLLDKDCSPFTFFNILYISRADFKKGKTDEAIVHEKAHYQQGHSFDQLVSGFVIVVQWFNPFAWLLMYALKAEHEYIADEEVLKEGFEMAGYQKSLFEKSLGITTLALTNAFNYSLLKKRLKMMTNKKSNSLAKMKFILSVPIVLVLCIFLMSSGKVYAQPEDVYTEVDVMPEYNGGMNAMREFLAKNLVYPKSARDAQVQAKVYVSFVVDETGKVTDAVVDRSDILDNVTHEVVVVGYKSSENAAVAAKPVSDLEMEAIRVVSRLGNFSPGMVDGKKVKVKFTVPVQFILTDKPS